LNAEEEKEKEKSVVKLSFAFVVAKGNIKKI